MAHWIAEALIRMGQAGRELRLAIGPRNGRNATIILIYASIVGREINPEAASLAHQTGAFPSNLVHFSVQQLPNAGRNRDSILASQEFSSVHSVRLDRANPARKGKRPTEVDLWVSVKTVLHLPKLAR